MVTKKREHWLSDYINVYYLITDINKITSHGLLSHKDNENT
jgi:hypothetical protein